MSHKTKSFDLGNAFLRFWFKPVSAYRLRVFSNCFVITFLLYMFDWFQSAEEWLTPAGFHLTKQTAHPAFVDPFPLLPPEFVPVFGIVLFGSIFCYLMNWRPRAMMWILFGIAVYIQNVDYISAFTLNKLYIFTFLVLATAPDYHQKDKAETREIPVWPVRALQMTLLLQYALAGLCKINHGDWFKNPDALWSQVQGLYRTEFAAFLLRIFPKWAWRVMMYFSLSFELFSPVLFCWRMTRWIAIVWGIGFHLIVAMTMHKLTHFSLQMVSFYILFLDDHTVERVVRRFKETLLVLAEKKPNN